MRLSHPFDLIFDKNSSILVLGTFPSVKSREQGFYYGHPQNRFWKVIADVTDAAPFPETISAKKQMLLANKKEIALGDVVQSCDIEGSGDNSIKNPTPTDLSKILNNASIESIFANGDKAYQLLIKYYGKILNQNIIKLPSTSPANAKYSLEQLIVAWGRIFDKSSFVILYLNN
ncbi:MAG: DNA-deoxyinosine glycosylase [Holosporales bacterium]|nr:DNA-deoxyinosine glycosylase [Holosporales bacterium]